MEATLKNLIINMDEDNSESVAMAFCAAIAHLAGSGAWGPETVTGVVEDSVNWELSNKAAFARHTLNGHIKESAL
jgi:hypothetical protein